MRKRKAVQIIILILFSLIALTNQYYKNYPKRVKKERSIQYGELMHDCSPEHLRSNKGIRQAKKNENRKKSLYKIEKSQRPTAIAGMRIKSKKFYRCSVHVKWELECTRLFSTVERVGGNIRKWSEWSKVMDGERRRYFLKEIIAEKWQLVLLTWKLWKGSCGKHASG